MKKLTDFVRSKLCFRLVLMLFVIESAWIALSASYPMPFDEDFHFGIIKLYAQQWSPFFTHQPAGGNAYGALTSDPSYLYHYLMSFPYRLTELFTNSQMAQVVTLRFIDIALMAWGLGLFRTILLKTKASPGLVNITMLFFTLVPVVPLLSAQINYDTLLLPLTALAILTTMRLKERLDTGTFPIGLGLQVAVICMLASLVQFEFLPVFAALAGYIGYQIWKVKQQSRQLQQTTRRSWHLLGRLHQVGYIAIFVIAFGLFSQRYGTNLVAYKTPVPQCNQVLTITQCSAYIPWERNYTDEQNKTNASINPAVYTADWIHGMFENSFFTSSSGADTAAFYIHVPPLPIISVTAIVIFSGGILLFVWYRKRILSAYPALGFLLFVSGVYCATLWLWNYHDFVHLGAAVALNGRYLFPIMPLCMLAIGLAYQNWLKDKPRLKAASLVAVLVLFLQGGGALTFIEASNPHWYWANDRTAEVMNTAAQKIVKPIIIGAKDQNLAKQPAS